MEAFKRLFNIEKWTYRELLFFVGAFLVLNIFAPRGFVQWVLIQQDIRRVKNETKETKARLAALEEEIRTFQRSDLIKEQKLRELGYLKPGELSLEFVDPSRKTVTREQVVPLLQTEPEVEQGEEKQAR
jgi:cell division protein FtsB